MQDCGMTIKNEGPGCAPRTLITTGAAGVVLGAICCATPLLALLFGAIGLTAWVARVDHVAFAMLALGVALIGFGLYRRHVRVRLHSDAP